MSNQCIVKVDHFDVSFRSLFDHLVEQTKWALSCLWASQCNAWSVYCESWSLWRELLFAVWLHDHLIMWSCCLWALQCDAWSVYVSITCAYRAVTALSMRLFSSSDKHSLQKIRSQHLIQINLVADLNWSSSWVLSWHFELESRLSRVAHIFNSTRLDSTENWVNSTWFVKNSSLMSRELNIENFPIFGLCITFLHYLLIESHEEKHEGRLVESHKGEHEGRLIESHDGEHEGKHEGEHEGSHGGKHEEEHEGEHEGETWRPFDFGRESWRGNMVESHEGDHEGCSTKLFTPI